MFRGNAGVVHQDVEGAAERLLQPPAGGVQGRVVGDVRGDGSRSSASLADSGRHRLGVRPGHVQDAHSCAAPTEGLGDGRADPLARPGDQNDPTLMTRTVSRFSP